MQVRFRRALLFVWLYSDPTACLRRNTGTSLHKIPPMLNQKMDLVTQRIPDILLRHFLNLKVFSKRLSSMHFPFCLTNLHCPPLKDFFFLSNSRQTALRSDWRLWQTSHPTGKPVDSELKLQSSQLKLVKQRGLSPEANLNPGSGSHTLQKMHGKRRGVGD